MNQTSRSLPPEKGDPTVNRAYRYRLYPNAEQKRLLAEFFGCSRLIYNHYLELKNSVYESEGRILSYAECAKDLTALKKTEEFGFLKKADSAALQQALRHLDAAFSNHFRNPSCFGLPNFKSKKRSKASYSTSNNGGTVRIEEGGLRLPKLGVVRMKKHRDVPDGWRLTSVTVSMTKSGEYYASLVFEFESQEPEDAPSGAVGLDFSAHDLFVDSEGGRAAFGRPYRKAEARLKKEQRRLSRKAKGSKNREKQRLRLAKAHEKVSNRRKDFLHKESRRLADSYGVVCVEDLNMRGMSRSLRLGKSVHDAGWGEFVRMLGYKLADRGGRLVKVGRFFPSSQTCSACGFKNPEVKALSVREWVCPACGRTHDRDVNAAVNVRNEGLRILLSENKT